ncbi:Splicing factor ESS-2 [Erysiphe necator]|nr:Splicing factor ESS-2 [Erysiphe necator]
MERSKSNSITSRQSDKELMPPPPKRIKRAKNVIDEESYTQAISEIIARDFFPGLLESETKQEYLDALESKNKAWISSAQRRLEQVMTPIQQNRRRGTSLQNPLSDLDSSRGLTGRTTSPNYSSDATNVEIGSRVDTNMSLDRFQSKYTSEDNESFYKLLDSQNQKRAEKYAWMWSGHNKIPSKMMLKQKETEIKLLKSRETLQDDGGKKDRLAIRDNSEKSIKSWNSKPNNGLMFIPDGVEDQIQTIASKAQKDSKIAPKRVVYDNTRMPGEPDQIESQSSVVPPSPSLSAVRKAISGNRQVPESDNECEGFETPRINGYAFVDDEPELESYQENKLIELGNMDSTKNPFTIKAQSRREDLLHRIVDKNARKKRQSIKYGFTGKVEQTPTLKFPSSPRVSSTQLTPAAQRLWSQVGTTTKGQHLGNYKF